MLSRRIARSSGSQASGAGNAKAIACARQLVYVEDQYLWSTEVARVFAEGPTNQDRARVLANSSNSYTIVWDDGADIYGLHAVRLAEGAFDPLYRNIAFG